MSTDAINLSAMTRDEIEGLDRSALADALTAEGVNVKKRATRAALVALALDLVTVSAPVTVESDLTGREVFTDARDAGNGARRALAGLPVWSRSLTDDDDVALGYVLGFAPAGGRSPVWSILRGPGAVQRIARWALAVVARESVALAAPVRRCTLENGDTVDRVDRVKGSKDGTVEFVPHKDAVTDGETVAQVIGYTPCVALTQRGANLVTALGIPGVSAGQRPESQAAKAIAKWAREWVATSDDGAAQVEGALDDVVPFARDFRKSKLSEAGADALRNGRSLATITRATKALKGRNARKRAQATTERAVKTEATKAAPIV